MQSKNVERNELLMKKKKEEEKSDFIAHFSLYYYSQGSWNTRERERERERERKRIKRTFV